jgi:hypothetical protein
MTAPATSGNRGGRETRQTVKNHLQDSAAASRTQSPFRWASTRSSWLPVKTRSPADWDVLFAHWLPEQRKAGCIFVFSRVEFISEMGRDEYWVEEGIGVGDMSLQQALALPVAGVA